MKKILSAALAVTLTISLTASALAATSETVSTQINRTIFVTYDGVKQGFTDVTGKAVYPVAYEGTTYLPVRAVSGLVGLNVDYKGDTNTVALTSGGAKSQTAAVTPGVKETVQATLNRELTVTYDGKAQTFTDANGKTVYPITYSGTTYLPVRAIGGLTGLNVGWDGATSTVILSTTPIQQPDTDTPVSSDWTVQEIVLDGTKLTMPFAYKTVEDMGWTVDFSDYKDLSESYILNPGDKVSGTISLSNGKYDKYFRFWVGFQNNASSAQTIKNCDVWSLNLERVHGTKLLESAPSVTIVGGLTWGSTMAQVKAALGEPKDSYRSDSLGYETLTYQTKDYGKYLKLTVYDASGIGSIQLQRYK